MAATIVDDAGVDSYAQQTSLGGFRVHNDCKYKNEIKIKLLSASAISNLEAEARCTGGAFFKSSMLNSSLQPTNKVGRGYLEFFRVSTLYGGGGGRRIAWYFRTVALFYERTQKLQKITNTASLSQGR